MSSVSDNGDGGGVYGGKEVCCGFVVACGDSAELLEFAKEVFDQVTRFKQVLIVRARFFVIGFGWNDRRHT